MANNPRLAEVRKATQFSSTRQPFKNGRKPSILKGIRKKEGISIQDIRIVATYIIDMNQEQLQATLLDEKKPYFWRVLARAYMGDLKNGRLDNTQIILERIVGKAKEYIEHSGSIANEMTKEQIENRINELLRKRQNQE